VLLRSPQLGRSCRWFLTVAALAVAITFGCLATAPSASAENLYWAYDNLSCVHIQLDLSGQPVQQTQPGNVPGGPIAVSGSGTAVCTGDGQLFPYTTNATLTFSGTVTPHSCFTTPAAEWNGTLDVARADQDLGPIGVHMELTSSEAQAHGAIQISDGQTSKSGPLIFQVTGSPCSATNDGNISARANDGSFGNHSDTGQGPVGSGQAPATDGAQESASAAVAGEVVANAGGDGQMTCDGRENAVDCQDVSVNGVGVPGTPNAPLPNDGVPTTGGYDPASGGSSTGTSMPASAPAGGWFSPAGQAEIKRLGDAGALPSDGSFVQLPSNTASSAPAPGFACAVRGFNPYRNGPYTSQYGYYAAASFKQVCRGPVAAQEVGGYLQVLTGRGWQTIDQQSDRSAGPGTIGGSASNQCAFVRKYRMRAYGSVSLADGRFYAGFNGSSTRTLHC